MESAVMPPSKRQKLTKKSTDCEKEPIVGQSRGAENCIDWRDKEDKYKLRHKHAMEQGILTDVKFTVGPEGTPFAAHKLFLALASPVFEAMFFGSLKETNEIIHIPDITPLGFKVLLDFVYSDVVNFSSEMDAFSTWLAAEKYCMPFLKDACFQYLTTCSLNDTNVWGILENALFLNSTPLVDKCKSYLQENISDALSVPSFLEVSKDVIEFLVMIDLLNIEEIILLRRIVMWGKEKMKNGTGESLQQLLQPFMKYIRFGCITQCELVPFIDENKNIIADKDIIELLKYMTNCDIYSLPSWCSANVFPRKSNDLYENPQNKSIHSYSLSSKHSQHENNPPLNDYRETQNSDNESRSPVIHQRDTSDSDDSEYMDPHYEDMRSLNDATPISSPISSISSFSDSSSEYSSSEESN